MIMLIVNLMKLSKSWTQLLRQWYNLPALVMFMVAVVKDVACGEIDKCSDLDIWSPLPGSLSSVTDVKLVTQGIIQKQFDQRITESSNLNVISGDQNVQTIEISSKVPL
jgi:hypothetical protein